MLSPRGFLKDEIGDVEVVAAGETLHLFYLVPPTCDSIRHATSSDGLSWTESLPALHVGPPGAFDDDRIWTVTVARDRGRWVMLYTALCRADDGLVQRVGLATSTDLVHWHKFDENPVCEADPRWYEATVPEGCWISWRDPKVTRVGERFFVTLCAKQNNGPLGRRGVVALCSSDDLVRWEVERPLFAPQQYCELECPQLFQVDGTYYLTAAVLDDRSQRYWIGDGRRGPFRTPRNGRLLPAGHYAARVCRWRDENMLLCWHQPVAAFGAAPLDLRNLTPRLENRTAAQRDGGLVVAEGMQLWELDTLPPDYLLRAKVVDAAAIWGFGIGVEPDGSGWYIELEPGAMRARVLRSVGRRDCNCLVFVREVRQEALLPASRRDVQRDLALRLVDGEIELALAGQVLLSTWLDLPREAKLSFFAVSGRVDFVEHPLEGSQWHVSAEDAGRTLWTRPLLATNVAPRPVVTPWTALGDGDEEPGGWKLVAVAIRRRALNL